MAASCEIVSLRPTGDDSVWLALILEGERLGQFRFSARPAGDDEQMRALIYAQAGRFSRATGVLEQFRALEQPQRDGDRIRRVVDVTSPLAAAA